MSVDADDLRGFLAAFQRLNELAASEADDSSMYGIDVSANGHGLRLISRPARPRG